MHAHLIAGLSRTKRLPPLSRLLVPVDPPATTRQSLRAALHVLSQQTGIPLRRVAHG